MRHGFADSTWVGMRTTLAILVIVSALGCHSARRTVAQSGPQTPSLLLSKQEVAEYFRTLKPGYPVRRIERDLGLRPSEDMEAPIIERPHWTVKYEQDGLVISFMADQKDPDADANRSPLIYVGQPSVRTYEEYVEDLRRMGVPVR